MKILRKQGLEQTFNNLNHMLQENPEALVCINCFSFQNDCLCKKQTLWPIAHAVSKFKLEYMDES